MQLIIRIMAVAAVAAALLFGQTKDEHVIWSPDRQLFALSLPGEKVGNGGESERLAIYTYTGSPVSVIHIWDVEPDGKMALHPRGCDDSGWIDSTRFYCEGSINPSTGVYERFDARSGKELGTWFGSNFTWSPDLSKIACFGNVPHFTDSRNKSDSLEVGRLGSVYPSGIDTGQHWFRSDIAWSADSRYVAVVDHRRRRENSFFLVVVNAVTGERFEHNLQWQKNLKTGRPIGISKSSGIRAE